MDTMDTVDNPYRIMTYVDSIYGQPWGATVDTEHVTCRPVQLRASHAVLATTAQPRTPTA